VDYTGTSAHRGNIPLVLYRHEYLLYYNKPRITQREIHLFLLLSPLFATDDAHKEQTCMPTSLHHGHRRSAAAPVFGSTMRQRL